MNIHHRHLSSTTGAIAAMASIISGLVGVIGMYTAPRGLRGLAVAVHIAHQPMLIRIAPLVTSFAVIAAAAAGVLRAYSWRRDRRGVDREE